MQDYENDALNNLKKILINKWDFVTMQAEEQVWLIDMESSLFKIWRPPSCVDNFQKFLNHIS